jgi:hypothetical protein
LFFPKVRKVGFGALSEIYRRFGGAPEQSPIAAIAHKTCEPLRVMTVFRRSKSKMKRAASRALAGQQGWARIAYSQSPLDVESAFLFSSVFTEFDESIEFGQLAEYFDAIGICQTLESIPPAVECRFESDIALHVNLTLQSLRQPTAFQGENMEAESDEAEKYLLKAMKARKLTPIPLVSMKWWVRDVE